MIKLVNSCLSSSSLMMSGKAFSSKDKSVLRIYGLMCELWLTHIEDCSMDNLNFLIILCHFVNTWIILQRMVYTPCCVTPFTCSDTVSTYFGGVCLFLSLTDSATVEWHQTWPLYYHETYIAVYKLQCYSAFTVTIESCLIY